MKRIIYYFKKDIVLTVSWVLAAASAFLVRPDKGYAGYIDWRSLGILWSLMIITKGYMNNGIFEKIGHALLVRTRKMWQLVSVLVALCFFSSMLTPIGNPQNLYLYGLAGVGAGQFIMWLLPYTIVSATLLIISIMLLKNKNADVSMKDTDDNSGQKAAPVNVLLYTILFIIALLVVARVLPWYVLTVLVLVTTFIIERNVLLKADYALLLTFVGFFIFTGNMGRIEPVALFLSGIADGREIGVGIITSQCISNVPAALLLSGFTHNIKNLALGVNIGGLGTLIASMASLISYKQYVNEVPDGKGKYFVTFTVYNVIFLIVLYACTKFI